MPRPHDGYPDEGSFDEERFDDYERISDEDVWSQIEESLREETVEVDVPPRDIKAIRAFLSRFNVINNGDEISDEDIERLWHELAKDPSITKDYPYMPAIFKDYAYILTDYRTALYRSELPVPPLWSNFKYYSTRLNEEGKEKFSSRLWVAEKCAIPNLTSLGLRQKYVTHNAYGDDEGRIKAAEFTRFLGWLAGQHFMAGLPDKLDEFKEDNDITQPSLTNVAQVATLQVLDARDFLRKQTSRYRTSYPMEPRARDQFEDNLSAMEGIYNLCDSILLGVKKQK